MANEAHDHGQRRRILSDREVNALSSNLWVIFGTAGLLAELFLAVSIFVALGDLSSLRELSPSPDPTSVLLLEQKILDSVIPFVSVALIWLSIILASLLWSRSSGTAQKIGHSRGRVAFGVLFGYLLVGAGVGAVFANDLGPQIVSASGLTQAEVPIEGIFSVRMATVSNITIPLFALNRPVFRVNIEVYNIVANVSSFQGSIVVGIARLQPPFSPSAITSVQLSNATRLSGLFISIPNTDGIPSGVYEISFSVRHYIQTSTGNFTGVQSGTISVGIRSGELSPSTYFFIVFGAVFMSFWWRIINERLEDQEVKYKGREALQIAFFFLVPFASAIMAAIVFGNLLQSLTQTADPFTKGVSVFVYGFFWENATEKAGRSITGVLIPKKADSDTLATPPQSGNTLALGS